MEIRDTGRYRYTKPSGHGKNAWIYRPLGMLWINGGQIWRQQMKWNIRSQVSFVSSVVKPDPRQWMDGWNTLPTQVFTNRAGLNRTAEWSLQTYLTRPTNHFDRIRKSTQIFSALVWQCNSRDVCKILLWSVKYILNSCPYNFVTRYASIDRKSHYWDTNGSKNQKLSWWQPMQYIIIWYRYSETCL